MSLVKALGLGSPIIEEYLQDVYQLKKTTFEDVKSGTIHESVNMFGSKVARLNLQLKKVEGDFICRYSKLASMENFPEHITGTLDISFTNIRSLDDIPDTPKMQVDGDFVCTNLRFTEDYVRSHCQVKGTVYC